MLKKFRSDKINVTKKSTLFSFASFNSPLLIGDQFKIDKLNYSSRSVEQRITLPKISL